MSPPRASIGWRKARPRTVNPGSQWTRLWNESCRLLTVMETVNLQLSVLSNTLEQSELGHGGKWMWGVIIQFLSAETNNLASSFSPPGLITMDEFIQGAQQDAWVLNMLKLDVNPAQWVLEQRRKSAHFWNISEQRPSPVSPPLWFLTNNCT